MIRDTPARYLAHDHHTLSIGGPITLRTAIAMYGPDQDTLRRSMGHIAQDAEYIHLYHCLTPSSGTKVARMKCEVGVLVGKSCTRSSTAFAIAGYSAQQDRWAYPEATLANQSKLVILFV